MSANQNLVPMSKNEIGNRLNGANPETCNGKRSILNFWDGVIADSSDEIRDERREIPTAETVTDGEIVLIEWDGLSRVLVTGKSSYVISLVRVDSDDQASRRPEDSRLLTFDEFDKLSR